VTDNDPQFSRFAGARVLITGGLGFIGSNLARRLVDLDAQVLLVDSLIPEYGGNLTNIREIRDRVQINISDIRDTHGLRHLVAGQDFLFNLAGQTSHLDSMTAPVTDLEINCAAQLTLLEACRAVTNGICCARPTSTASTRWPARPTTFSIIRFTACAPWRCA
jgi:UDP-glucose 4-epimerase